MATEHSSKPQAGARVASGHETRDARVGWLFGIVLSMAICGLIIHFAIAGVLQRLQRKPAPSDSWSRAARVAPVVSLSTNFPRLQLSAPAELAAFQAKENAELTTYAWLDRKSGIVRVPIDRAMDLLVQQGLPTASATNANSSGPSSYELIQNRNAQGGLAAPRKP